MTKHYKVTFAFLALVLSAFSSAHAATAAPKVVFIGDWVTANWNDWAAMPANWFPSGALGFNQCYTIDADCWGGSSSGVLARFQANVVALHPAIVHIMIGAVDADGTSGTGTYQYPYSTSAFLANLEAMVQQAKAADIQVILGIEPSIFSFGAPLQPINSIIASYGAQNGIPVINYADALCSCVDSVGGGSSINPNPYLGTPLDKENPGVAPTAAGYALMTQMAQAVINTVGMKLQGGYLQNVEQATATVAATANVNTVGPNAVVQFTPDGYYAGSLVEPFVNDNYAGSNGTWASSNPLVMYVNQRGLAYALSAGSAAITYTSPSGVKFSEWVMYVTD
jgi:lysophospholipase L1-like esterase